MRGDLKEKVVRYKKSLKKCSRLLRENMTEAEILLREKIRGKQLKGYQFYRQKTIGNYIVDFYSPKAKLVIELDGGQHYSSEGEAKDTVRDGYMKGIGLRVLRFSDKEVFENTQGVLERIWDFLISKISPKPLFSEERARYGYLSCSLCIAVALPVFSLISTTEAEKMPSPLAVSNRTGIFVKNRCMTCSFSIPMIESSGPVIPTSVI